MSEEEQAAASQGELGGEAMKRKEEEYEGKEGVKKVFTRSFFIGLEIEKRPSEPSSVFSASSSLGTVVPV